MPTAPAGQTPRSDNALGIAAMLAAMTFLIINDALVKLTSETLPVGQIIFVRGAVASAVIVAIGLFAGAFARPRIFAARALWVRTACEVGATMLYLTALAQMPIGTVTAILQLAPLLATAAGALFLAEQVGWRRWVATAIGFTGVIAIIQPGGANFDWAALLVIAALGFITVRDLVTRRMPAAIPTLAVTAFTAISVTGAGAVMSAFEAWQPMTLRELLFLSFAGVFLLGGYFFIVAAFRLGEVGAVAPFRYAIVVMSIVAGYLIWNEIPDALMFAGIALVVGAGIYSFWREMRLARAQSRLAAVQPVEPGLGATPPTSSTR